MRFFRVFGIPRVGPEGPGPFRWMPLTRRPFAPTASFASTNFAAAEIGVNANLCRRCDENRNAAKREPRRRRSEIERFFMYDMPRTIVHTLIDLGENETTSALRVRLTLPTLSASPHPHHNARQRFARVPPRNTSPLSGAAKCVAESHAAERFPERSAVEAAWCNVGNAIARADRCGKQPGADLSGPMLLCRENHGLDSIRWKLNRVRRMGKMALRGAASRAKRRTSRARASANSAEPRSHRRLSAPRARRSFRKKRVSARAAGSKSSG